MHRPAVSRIVHANDKRTRAYPMQRRRAKAIAIAQTEALKARLVLAAGLLLLPALLLLLISP